MQKKQLDVAVIGGGIVGCSILHELSFYQLNICLIEKQPDVCEGASKANSGIIHTGFDAKPRSIEAKCLEISRSLWPQRIEKLKIPYLPCGAIMVATNHEEKQLIKSKYMPLAKANGVNTEWIEREQLLAQNPDISSGAVGGLKIPGEGICDPFWATRAHAELAILNGAELFLGSGVQRLESDSGRWKITLDNNTVIHSKFVVNAAGLWADEIAAMVNDKSFSLTPRKGQFLLTEKEVGISQIVLPVPTEKSKGILASPVIFGGFLFGPTAEDQEDKWDRSTTEAGLSDVIQGCEKLIPEAASFPSIRQFAGVRAVSSSGDFIIRPSEQNDRLIHAAGIRSTGISASPGIAKMAVEQLNAAGLQMSFNEKAVDELPNLFADNEQGNGEIICLCRSISRNELENALSRPFSVNTIDGLKRRTGATLGECQGNGCIPRILDLLNERQQRINEPYKGLNGSAIAFSQEEAE